MAALATGSAVGAERKEQALPEVPLKWSDFVWSLEKLRHKPYSKKTTERCSASYRACSGRVRSIIDNRASSYEGLISAALLSRIRTTLGLLFLSLSFLLLLLLLLVSSLLLCSLWPLLVTSHPSPPPPYLLPMQRLVQDQSSGDGPLGLPDSSHWLSCMQRCE